VFLAGENFESFSGLEDQVVIVHFESQLSIQHVEELAGARVVVAYLARGGRHEFFNDAEFGCFDEVPAVAVGALLASPLVVLG
jgi:hypothetical protein